MECPNCKNTQGFAFGTCIKCGFNHISEEFEWIRVYVPDLDLVSFRDKWDLINNHKARTKK